MDLNEWAVKWGVSQDALRDLVSDPAHGDVMGGNSEAAMQVNVTLEACRSGWRLWRNNVGACTDDTGRHIRYGLCNQSRRQNLILKSSDLIGIRPMRITKAMVGQTTGQFVAVEVKHRYWKPGSSDREKAQGAFLKLVRSLGGHAFFSTGGIE